MSGRIVIESYRRSALSMDTLVSLQVATDAPARIVEERLARAFGWFGEIEGICSRFDAESEVMRLATRVGEPVAVSATLFTLVRFALEVARASGGAFDPTVGALLERRGFRRNYRTGRAIVTAIDPTTRPTYRDVELDPDRQTVTLRVPLILDLGAVAKGFAIDLAARELATFGNYAVEAGGDMAVGGRNAVNEPWHIGIRHPRRAGELIEHVRLSDMAICTSGDYERPAPTGDAGHHLVDPGTGRSPDAIASVTVIAPTAMLADALSTAATILGPARGLDFLAEHGVEGLIISSSLERRMTEGFEGYLQ